MKDKSYTRQSPNAIQVFEIANQLHQWMKDPRNKPVAKEFSTSIVSYLEKCIPPSDQFKTTQTRRERMWSNYHSFPTTYRQLATQFFCSALVILATSSETAAAGKEAPTISHLEAKLMLFAMQQDTYHKLLARN